MKLLHSNWARSERTNKGELQTGDGAQIQGKGKAEVLPEVNSIVLCKVTRITPRQANVAILVVGETVLDGEWQGLIRVQDVRATEKDRVKIFESFRPGDIVRAIVVSSAPFSTMLNSTSRSVDIRARKTLGLQFMHRYLSVINRTTTSLQPAII